MSTGLREVRGGGAGAGAQEACHLQAFTALCSEHQSGEAKTPYLWKEDPENQRKAKSLLPFTCGFYTSIMKNNLRQSLLYMKYYNLLIRWPSNSAYLEAFPTK